MDSFKEPLLTPKKNEDKWGYVDAFGNVIVPFVYDYAEEFLNKSAIIGTYCSRVEISLLGNNPEICLKYGLISSSGKIIVDCIYDEVKNFTNYLAAIRQNDKWGFVRMSGRIVIPIKYDSISEFEDGIVKIKIDGKYGLINSFGNYIVECVYFYIGRFCNDKAIIAKYRDGNKECYSKKKYGFIDKEGKEISLCIYDKVEDFKDGIAKVKLNHKWGFIDETGNEICPCIYDEIGDAHEDVLIVSYGKNKWGFNHKLGFITIKGTKITDCIYEKAGNFSNGLTKVYLNYLWGFIDKTGHLTIQYSFSDAQDFHEGLAWVVVKSNDKYPTNQWRLIDKMGKEIACIKPNYKRVYPFKNGVASVVSEYDEIGKINTLGQEFWSDEYEQVDDIDYDRINNSWTEDYFNAMTDGQFGSYDDFEGNNDDIDIWSTG